MSHELSSIQIEERITDLEERVESLEKQKRPGRKASPMLAPNQPGVCALDPECDSALCEQKSVFRYQQGCRGTACVDKNRSYYAEYRKSRREASSNGE